MQPPLPPSTTSPAVLALALACAWIALFAAFRCLKILSPKTFETLTGERLLPAGSRGRSLDASGHRPPILPTHVDQDSSHRTSPPPVHRLEIVPGSLRLTTSLLNSHFNSLAASSPRRAIFWRINFSLGVFFGVAAIVVGCSVVLFGVLEAARDVTFPARAASTVPQLPVDGMGPWSNATADRNDPSAHLSKETVGFHSGGLFTYSTGPSLDHPNPISGHAHYLVSLIPGVNLPLNALGSYFLALLLSGLMHEMGHASAAAVEKVPIQSTGVFVFLFFPGAFVELQESALAMLSPFRQLRIVCAGVWNNGIGALVSGLFLASLPIWLSPWYMNLNAEGRAGGVVVLDVKKESALHGHLTTGSIVISVDGEEISTGIKGWGDSLYRSILRDDAHGEGYCIAPELIFDAGPLKCCDVSLASPLGNPSNTLQCFLPTDILSTRSSLELARSSPKSLFTRPRNNPIQHSLPVRHGLPRSRYRAAEPVCFPQR
ncbi:hypothetical protein DFJ73DRAFT_503024 [Zopfochytrium polystomum]|nr:hypothetical protein DFJ73DRAFT_503024 [Zopfochytrium polystomum]